jgi:DeoR/GlpR family transcriptional regulator of sugar metabolism
MVETSRQVCVLADHTKWGTVGLSTIIPLSSVDLVVSDEGLGARARTALVEAGAEVTIAAQPRTRFDRRRRGTP